MASISILKLLCFITEKLDDMAQKDWYEVVNIFADKDAAYLKSFIESDELFAPNITSPNPFNAKSENFSAKELKKAKPGSWIPVYKFQDLPAFFHEHRIMPIRSGQAAFFFYKGEIFFDLTKQNFLNIETDDIETIESFIPSTLKANFQRNENAYLNKAVALGFMSHFLQQQNYHVLKRETGSHSKRLLYGQFGKIKTTQQFSFETSKGQKNINEGFQFEIDLVLENEEEIIIIEAKSSAKPTQSFSLLQLYYPLIYIKSIVTEPKRIRTIFVDITASLTIETYRFLEIKFEEQYFDRWQVIKNAQYVNRT